jgi:hypothetical protein
VEGWQLVLGVGVHNSGMVCQQIEPFVMASGNLFGVGFDGCRIANSLRRRNRQLGFEFRFERFRCRGVDIVLRLASRVPLPVQRLLTRGLSNSHV